MSTQTAYQRIEFPLDGREIVVGRSPECDVVMHGVGVSRRHATLRLHKGGPTVRDAGSTFGVRVDGRPVVDWTLTDGCTLTVGVLNYRVSFDTTHFVLERSGHPTVSAPPPASNDGPGSPAIRIGRDTINEVHLPHPLVSRHHSTLTPVGDTHYAIVDNGSTNGTFVNGRPIRQATLADGDIVQIGPYRFLFDEGKLIKAEDGNRIKLEAFGLTVRRRGRTLLNNVSLSIPPGEFVAILGPSGAGKTTLAMALTGQIPATEGSVFLSAFPLKQFVAAFRGSIGFVSQHNLLRPELTVAETFREQAILRLPRDSLAVERSERVREVMDLLALTPLGARRIAQLSGGEAKRVHLGIELLSSPTVVFLDEPLAGLDPGLIHRFMVLFRSLADRGHTLLLTTHTLEQIELCDRALFITQGKLAYNGPPHEATAAAGVATLAEVYEKAREEREFSTVTAKEQPQTADEQHKELAGCGIVAERGGRYRPRSVGLARQMGMLLPRYLRILVRDPRTALLIAAQTPLIAVLLALVFEHGEGYLPLSYYFCLTVSAIWMGGVNAVREIAREWLHYEREYRAGLSPQAYVLAKVTILTLVGLGQSVVFGLCLDALFEGLSFDWELGLLLWAATTGGSLLGLAVSAFSGSVNQAVTWLPIIFIPQIFFSGILIPFDRMSTLGRILSHLTVARPVFSLFKQHWVLEQPLWTAPCWRALGYLGIGLFILAYLRVRWGKIPRPT